MVYDHVLDSSQEEFQRIQYSVDKKYEDKLNKAPK